MNADCLRWAALGDREAVGEAVSEEEARFLRAHGEACGSCSREAALWRAVQGLGAGAFDEHRPPSGQDEAIVRRILKRHAATPRASLELAPELRWSERRATGLRLRAEPRSLRARTAALVAAGSLGAAAAAVLLHGPEPRTPQAVAYARARVARVSGLDATGGGPAAGDSMQPGDPIASGAAIRSTGDVCLEIEPDVGACLGPLSEASLADMALAHRVVELERGRIVVSLGHQPAGSTFSVATPGGVVTAVGTAFEVEVGGGSGAIVVTVEEGAVMVHAKDGRTTRVAAHEQTVVGSSVVTPSSESTIGAATVPRPGRWDESEVAVAVLRTVPAGGSVEIDGIALGPAPVSTLLGTGNHRALARWMDGAQSMDAFHLSAGQRLTRDIAREPSPSPGPALSTRPPHLPSAAPALATGRPAAANLLARARELRGEGRYAEARDTYLELEAAHPSSAEAHAAFVSLGDIELSQLGDAASALRAFEAYLSTGGVLSEEASFGRIRALEALGRGAEARAAIDAFLAEFPASLHAPGLRRQLGADDAAP